MVTNYGVFMNLGVIKLQEKIVYGKPRYYPGNPLAYKLLALMEQKSFTAADLPRLKDLGLGLQIDPPELTDLPWALQVAAEKENAAAGHSAIDNRMLKKEAPIRPDQQKSTPTSPEKTLTPEPQKSIPKPPVDNSNSLTITRKDTEDESFEDNSHQVPIWQAPK
jgi:hypothetical protein